MQLWVNRENSSGLSRHPWRVLVLSVSVEDVALLIHTTCGLLVRKTRSCRLMCKSQSFMMSLGSTMVLKAEL